PRALSSIRRSPRGCSSTRSIPTSGSARAARGGLDFLPCAAGRGMTARRLLAVVLAFSALRLAAAPLFELFPQEAYYDLYARHLSLSYFDHPPLIGWFLWLFTGVLGHRAWVLRLCAFTLTAGTQLALWRLVAEAVEPERRAPALLLLASPLMAVVSLIATPDVPLLLFWALALLALWRAFHGAVAARPHAWLLAGMATGLALDSKYTAAFLFLGALLLLLDPLHRRQLATPWPYLAFLVAVALTAPVWIWNAQHDFASLRFQTLDRARAAGFQLRFLGSLVGTQLVLLGALFVAFAWAAVRAPWLLRRVSRERRPALLFFLAFSAPPIALFVGLSLFVQVKPNWLYPFYLAAVP